MDSLEKKLEWVSHRLALEEWEFNGSGYSDSLNFYRDLYLFIISSSELFQSAVDDKNITDRAERQRLQILLSETLTDRIELRPSIAAAKDSIYALIDSFKVDFQGEVKSLAQVKGIYFNSRSRTQREQACRAWFSVGEELSPRLTKIIKERNAAATKLGFENYWDLISSQFSQNGVDIVEFVRSIDSVTQPANTSLFEEARAGLGINQIELWDIPFFSTQVNDQANAFFPADSQLGFAKRGLASVGFNIDKLPIFIQEVTKRPVKFDIKSYSVKPPHDVRVLINLRNGFESMHALFYHIGIALHSVYIAQERPLYNFASDTTWQMAMGETISSMTKDSAWLKNIVNMPSGFISTFRISQYQQEVFRQRLLLANTIFIYEAYSNPDRDLNRLYWDIYQKFTGLPRHEDIIIWASLREMISEPINPVRELVAKAIAAQSVNYMTSFFGPFINNPNTSSFLIQNYFRFGSRYAWSEMLQRGTGERLSPNHLKKLF